MGIATLLKSFIAKLLNATLLQCYIAPMLHSSNAILLQCYIAPMLHCSNPTLLQCYTSEGAWQSQEPLSPPASTIAYSKKQLSCYHSNTERSKVKGQGKNLVINRNSIVKKWKFENFDQNLCYIPQKKAKNI